MTLINQEEYSFTSFTASPRVARILTALGFSCIDNAKRVYLAWKHIAPILRGRRNWVINAPEIIEGLLSGAEREIWQDHRSPLFRHYIIRRFEQYSYLVLRRRLFPGSSAFSGVPIRKLSQMWYPGLEVVHLSRPDLTVPFWADVVGAVLRRERVWALVAPERFLGESIPPGPCFDHRSFLLDRANIGRNVDALYSEFATLLI